MMNSTTTQSSIPYTIESVCQAINEVFITCRRNSIEEANLFLIRFQQAEAAWPICINLLNQHANSDFSQQEFQFISQETQQARYQQIFASQTLCAQAQAGFPQQLSNSSFSRGQILKDIRDGLCNLIYLYRFGPKVVLRQLAMAVSACLAFAHGEAEFETEAPIPYLMNGFGLHVGEEGYMPLMEIMSILAEELYHHRIAISHLKRVAFVDTCLNEVESVLHATSHIYERALVLRQNELAGSIIESPILRNTSISPAVISPSGLMRSAMQCFKSWIWAHLQRINANSNGKSNQKILHKKHNKKLFEYLNAFPIFGHCINTLVSSDFSFLQTSCDALVYILDLTHSGSNETLEILVSILTGYVALMNIYYPVEGQYHILNEMDAAAARTIMLPLLQLAKDHFYNMINQNDEVTSVLHKINKFMMAFLYHDDISVRHQALDFWSSLLSDHLPQSDVFGLMVYKATDTGKKSEIQREYRRKILEPFFTEFVSTLCQQVEYPERVDKCDFDFEEFQKYRDECAFNLTESTVIVGHQFILSKCGIELVQLVEKGLEFLNTSWCRIEACLFVLTTVASRAPAGGDSYIPMALKLLPQLPYPDNGAAALLLRCAAGRLILWTAGYVGSHKSLFASLFQLLAEKVALYNFKTNSEYVKDLRKHTESLLVQAINALTASAGLMLVEESAQEDMNVVLNALTAHIVAEGMSLENRALLVLAAGSILSYLSKDRMEDMHMQLVDPLGNRVKALGSYNQNVKLFFTALQCVRPVEQYPAPSTQSDADGMRLEWDTSHPVLNVLTKKWPLVEEIVAPSKSDSTVEHAYHSIVGIFSNCRSHVTRYIVFFSFLDLLGRSYIHYPTVYHLGALRNLFGIFSHKPDRPVLQALTACLKICVDYFLDCLRREGENFLSIEPDIVGMSVDCVNIALLQPLLMEAVIKSKFFEPLLQVVIQFTPTCLHPKVLHTFMVFFSRTAAWVDPPNQLHSYDAESCVPWLKTAAKTVEHYICELLLNPLQSEQNYVSMIISSVVKALTNVHIATQSWIGNVTQVFLPLLYHQKLGDEARKSLYQAIMNIPSTLMTKEHGEAFFNDCITITQPRLFSAMLQTVCDETQAQYSQAQFKGNSEM